MKFFTKIYLLFLLVVIFSSLTSTLLLFQFIEQTNLQEASQNMKEGSDTISMNFHSVERNMWRYLAKIQNDEILAELAGIENPSHEDIISHMLSMPQPLEVDFIVLSSGDSYTVLPLTSFADPYGELYNMSMKRWHPNVGISRFNHGLSMIASIRLGSGGHLLDAYFVKDFNRAFCEKLTYNTIADILVVNQGKVLHGSIEERKLPVTIPGSEADRAYSEVYGIMRDEREYNAVIRSIDIVDEDRSDVIIISLFSNFPYTRRVELLSSRIVIVIFLSAALAMVISLGFSRTVTRPILALSNAIIEIKKGDYSVSVPPFNGREISRLVEGFNTMTRNLKEDQIAQQSYISEIKYLSDYNEKIIESIGAGICIINEEFSIEKYNREFRDIFERELKIPLPSVSREIGEKLMDEKISSAVRMVLSGQLFSYSSGRITCDDRFYQIKLYHLSGNKCIMTIDNITYRSVLEDRLYQAERLSSLSVLSAGVAHEINNPLSSIMTNVQNLIYDERDPERLEALKWVDQETRRIARIVTDLLNFSSSSQTTAEYADITDIVKQLIRFSGYSSGKKKLNYITELPDSELVAAVSSDEIKQILFNLLLNAEQASGSKGEIKITAKVRNKTIIMQIIDNGEGMDQETLARIYDPFFTTKKEKGGTGLGLSVVYGIIRKYQADIRFDSVPSAGTTVTLELPLYIKEE